MSASHTRELQAKGGSWGGSTKNTHTSGGGPWISLSRKDDHRSELDTISQAEHGIFIPPDSSDLGNKLNVWHNDELRNSDNDDIPLQPKAIHVQKEVKVNRSLE